MGEEPFWEDQSINPLQLASKLYTHTGDEDAAVRVLADVRA